jgi:hypothetical protein
LFAWRRRDGERVSLFSRDDFQILPSLKIDVFAGIQ